MTTDTWLITEVQRLETAGIATARLDCLVLLEDATGKDRSWLLAHPEFELESLKIVELKNKIKRRVSHEPLAYIRGKSEFYGREFAVNAHTLEPRPETETMIQLLLERAEDNKVVLVDVGTGSGCIAITAKLELPSALVYATDIDKKCLETARQNAKNRGADVKFFHGNLLQPLLDEKWEIGNETWAVLANLPYVPDEHYINEAAKHEPKHAIFGGPDGLKYYREMFAQIDALQQKPKFVLTEALPPQHKELTAIALAAGYKMAAYSDFILCMRVIEL